MEQSDELTVPPRKNAAEGAEGTAEIDGARLTATLDRLVERGVLDQAQAGAVVREYRGRPGPPPREGVRRRLGEIAGYLGASFVLGATLLFLGEQWDDLGRAGRVSVLAVVAVLLAGSGVAVGSRTVPAGRRWWSHRTGDRMRRRLAGTLLTGAAAAAGFAVYAALEITSPDTAAGDYPAFVAALTGLAVAIVGYLFARSALGQLATAVAAFAAYGSLLGLVHVDEPEALGLGMLALGVVWALAAWRRLVTEGRFALAIAVTFGLAGAQVVALGDGPGRNFPGYALTALVAGVCFTAYAWILDWVVLTGGVVGASVVVPEFLYEVTGGSVGVSGVMLAAGVTLLAGSLTGLRIRRPRPGGPHPFPS